MKKQVIAATLAALVALAGCNGQPSEEAAANAETVADDIEARANALEAQAMNATMPVDEPFATNATDAPDDTTLNQADAAR